VELVYVVNIGYL